MIPSLYNGVGLFFLGVGMKLLDKEKGRSSELLYFWFLKTSYILFLKGAFSDVLEGVVLKSFCGKPPDTLSYCITAAIKQCEMLLSKLLNIIQCVPFNSTLNEIFLGQSPKCRANLIHPSMINASYALSGRKLMTL